MKTVLWTDKDGYRHRSLIRDDDPESEAQRGLPQDPPDLHNVDWEGVIRDIHNKLVEGGVMSYQDLMGRRDVDLKMFIVSAVKPRVIAVLRSMEVSDE